MSSYTISFSDSSMRNRFRVNHPSLKVEVGPDSLFYLVYDLSSGGLAFEDIQQKGVCYPSGQKITINLWLKRNCILRTIRAKVVRNQDSIIAVQFLKPTTKQETFLDKLILNIQKLNINKQKHETKT